MSVRHTNFYKGKRWLRTRESYYQSINGLCERCFANGEVTPCDIVHHKIELNEENMHDEEIAYGFDNLEGLCQSHHNEEHFRKNKTGTIKGLRFNEKGELIEDE